MKISQIGEFGLIELISSMVSGHKQESDSWKRLLVGIGDDAALWKGSGRTQVATTDSLVEGVHFSLKYCDWESLGWKALAVNLSDIAAMGGYPLYVLVSLSLPGTVQVQEIASFYNGMLELCSRSRAALAGGNLSNSKEVIITLTVLGELHRGKALLRSKAKPGELVALSGHTGMAAAGLEVLQGKIKVAKKAGSIFKEAFLRPKPRLKEAQLLVEKGVKASIDISDGLIADLRHICVSSKVEMQINVDSIPVHALLRQSFGKEALDLALAGGEDYELAFTCRERFFEKIKAEIGCPVTVIGKVVRRSEPGKIILKDSKGKSATLPEEKGGWEHFR